MGAGVVGEMLDGLRGVGGVGDVVECLGGNVLVAAAGDAAANLCGGVVRDSLVHVWVSPR